MTSVVLSVAIVDEQPLLLKVLASRLEAHGFTVRATLRSAEETLDLLRSEQVDVVVLGLALNGDGLTCLREIRAAAPDVRVVVCNGPGEGDPEGAFAEGAAVFVEKSGHPDDVVSAVRQSLARSIFISPSAGRYPERRTRTVALTPREREVVALVADGGTNTEIAAQLWVSEQTVKFHLSNIYRKLGVSNRTEMSRYAQLRGLLPARPPAKRRATRAV
jgi:DNA-binding NarL/FixJ family response regulator